MKALIVWGGWEGHEPDKVAEIFRRRSPDGRPGGRL